MAPIVVVGSLNIDFVVRVPHLPAPGETILGDRFQTIPGGKGANQAYAAARLGASVQMIGRVGYDVFGDQLRASLAAAGVDVSSVHSTKSASTGVAMIWVDDAGNNSIVVAPGANALIDAAELASFAFEGSEFALFQLETPLQTVTAGVRAARKAGAITILDPAPADPLPPELLAQVDILTPNETEACILLGSTPSKISLDEAPIVAAKLLDLGPGAVIIKLGERGCYYANRELAVHSSGFAVEAVDTTAAGDTFNAAFAVASSLKLALPEVLRYANAAAAISVTRHGAQPSAPSHEEVVAFLAAR